VDEERRLPASRRSRDDDDRVKRFILSTVLVFIASLLSISKEVAHTSRFVGPLVVREGLSLDDVLNAIRRYSVLEAIRRDTYSIVMYDDTRCVTVKEEAGGEANEARHNT
jgi:hypothetical protein